MRRYVKSRSGGLSARWLLLCVMILSLSIIYPDTAQALTGAGTSEDPYLISTADDLDEFKDKVNSGEYSAWGELTCDIDLSQLTDAAEKDNWTPIGILLTSGSSYQGLFDGKGYTISNLKITGSVSGSDAGLFGSVERGRIENLTVQGNVNVDGDINNDRAGLIAGSIWSGSFINNCHTVGTVTASYEYVAGIVGLSFGECTVSNCTYSGTVTGGEVIGGIVGANDESGYIINCINYGAIAGQSNRLWMGGITGISDIAAVQNCVNMGSVDGTSAKSDSYIGGIVGMIGPQADLIGCFSIGKVTGSTTGESYTGGIAGSNGYSSDITNCGWVNIGDEIKGVGSGSAAGTYELSQQQADNAVAALSAEITSNIIAQNGTATITLVTAPGTGTFGNNGNVRNVEPESSAPSIASAQYNNDGTITITGIAKGTAEITVNAVLYATDLSKIDDGGVYVEDAEPYTATFTVTVTDEVKPSQISFSEASKTMTVSETATLQVIYAPENATDKAVTWDSDSSAVTVEAGTKDGEATITAVSEGTATVTATSAYGSLTASIEMPVTAAHDEGGDTPAQPVSDGGGGCSTGLGALTLMAAVPLMIRRGIRRSK